MAKDRFDKLEQRPVGKKLDPSTAGSTSRRFRRWLEFKGEKHVPLELEPERPTPAPGASGSPATSDTHRPQPTPTTPRGYSREQLAAMRAERRARDEELRAAQDRARRARNRLLWILGGFGGIGYLIYLLTGGGIGDNAAQLIIMLIAAIVVTIIRGGRGRRDRWDD